MSAAAPALSMAISSSVTELAIAFPLELQKVFDRLEAIRDERPTNARKQPSDETLSWAQEVLLGVVPSTYLIGAEIDPFESEIHATWEDETAGKSVIVFFPNPLQIKLYSEWIREDTQVREHQLLTTEDPSQVSARLRWFFQ
jgi:hypothetical protein